MPFERYESRFDAGNVVADLLKRKSKKLRELIKDKPHEFFCFAIPNGGVPVVEAFCEKLNLYYDILILRKLKIPYNPEAGFGSMTTDGTVLLNENLLNHLHLSKGEINKAIEITRKEIKERLEFYNKNIQTQEKTLKNVSKKNLFLLDDGLASGFTMIAAIKMIKKYNPKNIYIAVPTAPLHTVEKIKPEVDEVYCPNIRNSWRFAVAEAYKHWYDVSELEVIKILNNSRKYYDNLERH